MPVDPAETSPDAGFDVVRRGYDQGQVDTHLRRIDAEISILAADRNAAVDQSAQLGRELDDARARAEKLRAQVRTLAGPPQSVQGMSERMRSMLRLAEDEVSDMLGRAETEAAQRRQEAEQEAAQTLAAAREEAASFLGPAQREATELAERAARERAQLVTDRLAMERKIAADRAAMEQEIAELRSVTEARLAEERSTVEQALAAQRATVERDITELTGRSAEDLARMQAESDARRAEVEEDFTIAMDQRRSEALAALGAERAALQREIDGMRAAHTARIQAEIRRAEEHARAIVADAERRVAELTALRSRITEQLGGTQALLGTALGSLDPIDGEPGHRTNGRAAAPAPAPAQAPDAEAPTGPATDLDPPTVRLNADTLTDVEPVRDSPSPTPRPTPTRRERDPARAPAGRR
jgi:cell division septum initiation protein DivIVA